MHNNSSMSGRFSCPKCGREQPPSEMCVYCGIIFSKYHELRTRREKSKLENNERTNNSLKHIRSIFTTHKIISIGIVIISIFVIGVLLANKYFDESKAKEYFKTANALSDSGDERKAIKCYDKAIELDPEFANAFHNRAISLFNLGKYEESIKDLEKAIELNPKKSTYFNSMGICLVKLTKFKQAIEYFNRSLELNPDYAIAYDNRGVAFMNQGEYDRALEDFDTAIELDSNNAQAYYNRATLWHLIGNDDRKEDDRRMAASLGYEKSDLNTLRSSDDIFSVNGQPSWTSYHDQCYTVIVKNISDEVVLGFEISLDLKDKSGKALDSRRIVYNHLLLPGWAKPFFLIPNWIGRHNRAVDLTYTFTNFSIANKEIDLTENYKFLKIERYFRPTAADMNAIVTNISKRTVRKFVLLVVNGRGLVLKERPVYCNLAPGMAKTIQFRRSIYNLILHNGPGAILIESISFGG